VGPFTKRFARLVREQRRAKGWTQERLAESADLAPKYISMVEHAQVSPTIETVSRIARALGVTLGQLFPDESFVAASHARGAASARGASRASRKDTSG
jgi:transcriptional regulator with XRE-family HTH domain